MTEDPKQKQPIVPVVVKRTGRAPALDARKKKEICALVALGCSRNRAAMAIGCHRNTIADTMRREPEFAEQIRKAEVKQEIALLARIEEASKERTTWKAAAWMLERRYPDRYGARKPGTMTKTQVGTVLAQFAEIVSRGVHDPKDRRKVVNDLKVFVAALNGELGGD